MEERYTIIEELGSGVFGFVYRARDEKLKRDVALKRLDHYLVEGDLLERLLKEARILASMQHPNIVSVYDVSTNKYHAEIVMELLKGVSLDCLVGRHLLLASDLKNVAIQVLSALETAHELGVVHCDLKPENIMLCLAGGNHYEAKVYGFSRSRHCDAEVTGGDANLRGSIYVMAPELFHGEKASPQTDLYALGCILYYLLVGLYPFRGESAVQVMAAHVRGSFESLAECRSDLPNELCRWIESLIQPDVEARVRSSQDALASLSAMKLYGEESGFVLPVRKGEENEANRKVWKITLESLTDGDCLAHGDHAVACIKHAAPLADVAAMERPEGEVSVKREDGFPDGDGWYFSDGEHVKGPLDVEHLKRLCLIGMVGEETLVWHAGLSDWVKAERCPETRAVFDDAESFLKERELEAVDVREQKALRFWLRLEVFGFMVVSVLGLILFFVFPMWREEVVLSYFGVLLVLGLVLSRVYQRREKAWWGYFVPVVGDLLYGVQVRRSRVTLCLVMIFVGVIGIAMEVWHRVEAEGVRLAEERVRIENGVMVTDWEGNEAAEKRVDVLVDFASEDEVK